MIETATKLWTESEFELLLSLPSEDDVRGGLARLEDKNKIVKRHHEELIHLLMDAIHNNNL